MSDALNEIPRWAGQPLTVSADVRKPYDQAVEDLVYDRKSPRFQGYGMIRPEYFNEEANLMNAAQTPPVVNGNNIDFMEAARRQEMQNAVNAELSRMMRVPQARPIFQNQQMPEQQPEIPNPLYYKEQGRAMPRFA